VILLLRRSGSGPGHLRGGGHRGVGRGPEVRRRPGRRRPGDGLLTVAYPAPRADLERASDLFRQLPASSPTPDLAQAARAGLATALSPNERLQQLYHPWTSYLIVPLFALRQRRHPDQRRLPRPRLRSPITLGILIGYVAGKPIGITGASWLLTRLSRGRLRPPVAGPPSPAWADRRNRLRGVILIASLAFTGTQLQKPSSAS